MHLRRLPEILLSKVHNKFRHSELSPLLRSYANRVLKALVASFKSYFVTLLFINKKETKDVHGNHGVRVYVRNWKKIS